MIEADKLLPQGGKAAAKIIENMQQALAIWREQNEPSWEAWSLVRIGCAHCEIADGAGRAILQFSEFWLMPVDLGTHFTQLL
jgi:hypothetical protein